MDHVGPPRPFRDREGIEGVEGVLVGCVGGAKLVELEDEGVLANVEVGLYGKGSRDEINEGVGSIGGKMEGVFKD